MPMRKTMVFKWLAAALFMAVVLRFVRWNALGSVLSGVDGRYAAAAFAFSFLMVAVSCWKWWYILRLQGLALPFPRLYRWYIVGYFFSNFFPSNMGGDVVRAALSGRQSGSGSGALVAVFAERFTGLICLLILAAVGPFTHASLWRLPSLWIPSLIAVSALTAMPAVFVLGRKAAWGRFAATTAERLAGVAPARLRPAVESFARKLAERIALTRERGLELAGVLRRRPVAALGVAALTLLFYGITAVNVAVCYLAFGVWPDVALLLRVLPAALIVAMLPITPGSLGLAEGSYVFYFGLTGMAPEATLAVSILLRLKVLFLGAIGMVLHANEPWKPRRDPTPPKGIRP